MLSFFEWGKGRVPSFDKLLDGADIDISIMKKFLQGWHVLYQKTAILPDGIPAHGGSAFFTISGNEA